MAFFQSYNFSQKCHYIRILLSHRFLFCNWYHIFTSPRKPNLTKNQKQQIKKQSDYTLNKKIIENVVKNA